METRSPSYRLRYEVAVGTCGSQNGYRGATGSKRHMLSVQRIVADLRPVELRRKGSYQQGQAFSVKGFCNGNGQNTGQVIAGLDTNAVTCQKCQRSINGRTLAEFNANPIEREW